MARSGGWQLASRSDRFLGMRIVAVVAAVAVSLCVAAVLAAPRGGRAVRAVKTEGGIPSINFEKYQLANGLQVILAEDHRLPLVAFNLWFHVGARNEVLGRTGFAHLFEHLMFAGTKHLARGVADKLVEGVGGTDSNGSTDFDRTRYYFTLPSSELELGLWIKSDMMGYMIDEIDQVSLSNQQDVVRNERRQSVENQPYGIVEEAVYHALFPKDHPHYASVIGSHADIQAATLEDVKEFFKTYYRPNNATLVLAGDFDRATIKQRIEKYFGPLKPGDSPPPVAVSQPRIAAERRVVVTDRVELPRLYLAWHTPAALKPGDAELDLVAHVLGGGKSSRLYKSLVYDKQIAQEVSASQYSLTLGSVFTIEATARPGHTAAELERAIDEELTRLASSPPAEEELTRARNTLETRLLSSLEKVMGIAEQLNSYNQLAGDPGFLPRDIARYRAIKPGDLTRLVKAQLGKSSRVVVEGRPGPQQLAPEVPTPPPPGEAGQSERESVNADEAWRAHRPKAGASRPLLLPAGRSYRLPSGLTVVHVANPGVPVVSATLVVKAGTDTNPADRPGLAGFTAAMLQEGTTGRSALQLANDIAALGASFDVRASNDDSRIQVSSLKSSFPAVLDILADVLLNPAFDQQEIERQKKSRLARLMQQRENPGATAGVVAAASLFGPDHPLGRSPLGTEAAIQATTRADLERFWRSHYRPSEAALVVVGDVSFEELRPLVETRLRGWKSDLEVAGKGGSLPRPAPTAARLVLVDKPGAAQTALQVVSFAPRAADPEVPALSVMNAILGGNFTSRINHTLREVKGYSYGIYSSFAHGRDLGAFAIRGSVRTDVTGPAVADLFAEIEGVRGKPVPAAELRDARNSQLLSLPGLFDTNGVIAGSLAAAWSRGQGLDYYVGLPRKLARVDAATAHKLARKHVLPDQLVVVAVGDKAKIAPQLEKLRKPVEVRDVDGNLVKNLVK
jgi:zinc protease